MVRFLLVPALLLAALALPGATLAGKPSNGCGPGFDIGEVTLTAYLSLPRTAAAIDDGLVTSAEVTAHITAVDMNGDGAICVKLPYGFVVGSLPFGEYFYNLADNNASVP